MSEFGSTVTSVVSSVLPGAGTGLADTGGVVPRTPMLLTWWPAGGPFRGPSASGDRQRDKGRYWPQAPAEFRCGLLWTVSSYTVCFVQLSPLSTGAGGRETPGRDREKRGPTF